MLSTSIFVDDVMFSHNYSMAHVYSQVAII